MPSIKCPQRNTQHTVCTCHFARLSKQNGFLAFCLIATSVIFFLETPHATWQQSKRHVDGGWVFLPVVGFFMWNERSVLGDSLGVVAITITLPSRTPPLPALVNSSRRGTVEWTKSLDRLIHRACRSDVKRPPPVCCCHHYLSLLPPLHPPILTSCRGDRS